MFDQLTNFLKSTDHIILILIFFTALIVLYSVFIFYFYKFLSKKNIIELNLNQYNQYDNQTIVKILAGFLYIIEYIILLPVLTFFWFAILSILILVLAQGIELNIILLISAALVASVRVVSYISENLSEELAKFLPFTLLAVAITSKGFFDIPSLLARVSEIPTLFSNVPYYLLFIVAIELFMRIAEFAQLTFQFSKVEEKSFSEQSK